MFMSTVFSLPEREPLRFAISDRVTTWNPSERRLELGSRECWVVPSMSVSGVAPGTAVTVRGHVEGSPPRWIVTALRLDA
jgi:hypothetical protein